MKPLDISNTEHTCNTIVETFFDKTTDYNGCVISLRLCKEHNERDSFYHLVYYGISNYKLVLGLLNEMPFFSENEHFSYLSYHDSCWRYDSYRGLQKILKCGNYRKISIEEITPVSWIPNEFLISSNCNSPFIVNVTKCKGSITTNRCYVPRPQEAK